MTQWRRPEYFSTPPPAGSMAYVDGGWWFHNRPPASERLGPRYFGPFDTGEQARQADLEYANTLELT